ncbi:hypothetical protein HU200_022759 [Digitaria exilis]|uniref:Uncharacterized protein n=1 Tax=Digitaria exilis TaxID=1010633 RepID=A0A835C4V4_9POAL|nr:hypothetical protein HU200_022759 [Digitaria exilis]
MARKQLAPSIVVTVVLLVIAAAALAAWGGTWTAVSGGLSSQCCDVVLTLVERVRRTTREWSIRPSHVNTGFRGPSDHLYQELGTGRITGTNAALRPVLKVSFLLVAGSGACAGSPSTCPFIYSGYSGDDVLICQPPRLLSSRRSFRHYAHISETAVYNDSPPQACIHLSSFCRRCRFRPPPSRRLPLPRSTSAAAAGSAPSAPHLLPFSSASPQTSYNTASQSCPCLPPPPPLDKHIPGRDNLIPV